MAIIRSITPDTVRRLAITCQGLEGKGFRDKKRSGTRANKHEIMNTFRSLGCVQIDPIRAVERTQLLVLWSRLGQLDLTQLDKLMWQDRRLFEYWGHAASIVMTNDFPIYWRHMRDWAVGDHSPSKRAKKWVAENQELQQFIVAELEEKGPLPSVAFHDKSNTKWQSGGWTNGQTSRIMLDFLWQQGHILVSHRKGLTKYWDLRERCLPEWTPRDDLSWEETVFKAAQKSLLALGVARPAHIKNHFTRGNYPELEKALNQFVIEGLVEQLQIVDESGIWPGVWYIHRDRIPVLNRIEQGIWEPRTALLSPFDNLICHRQRTEELFDFHFRIEIYVPKAKRQYGYYVMPILYGDKLIGRVDPKMDRKKNQLTINAIYAEIDAPVTKSSGRAVADVLEDLAGFLGARDIKLDGKVPEGWRSTLAF